MTQRITMNTRTIKYKGEMWLSVTTLDEMAQQMRGRLMR